MKTRRSLPVLTLLVLLAFSLQPATGGAVGSRAIVFDLSPGTGAPPATLGGFTMTPVPSPGAPACTGLLPPLTTPGGPLAVAPTETLSRCVGSGWATWSHGYLGDVYHVAGGTSQTLTLPPATSAFYFYVQPDPFSPRDFEVLADGVSSGEFSVDGSGGAVYVGVFDNSGGTLGSITVRTTKGGDFSTGEYGIAFRTGCPCLVDVSGTYGTGTLSLGFTLSTPGPATWANSLVLLAPSIAVIPLWTVPLPVICPAAALPISFPLPSVGTIGIYSGLYDATGALCSDLIWINTGP